MALPRLFSTVHPLGTESAADNRLAESDRRIPIDSIRHNDSTPVSIRRIVNNVYVTDAPDGEDTFRQGDILLMQSGESAATVLDSDGAQWSLKPADTQKQQLLALLQRDDIVIWRDTSTTDSLAEAEDPAEQHESVNQTTAEPDHPDHVVVSHVEDWTSVSSTTATTTGLIPIPSVGMHVASVFEGLLHKGTVTEQTADGELWKVVYPDGDSHELSTQEVIIAHDRYVDDWTTQIKLRVNDVGQVFQPLALITDSQKGLQNSIEQRFDLFDGHICYGHKWANIKSKLKNGPHENIPRVKRLFQSAVYTTDRAQCNADIARMKQIDSDVGNMIERVKEQVCRSYHRISAYGRVCSAPVESLFAFLKNQGVRQMSIAGVIKYTCKHSILWAEARFEEISKIINISQSHMGLTEGDNNQQNTSQLEQLRSLYPDKICTIVVNRIAEAQACRCTVLHEGSGPIPRVLRISSDSTAVNISKRLDAKWRMQHCKCGQSVDGVACCHVIKAVMNDEGELGVWGEDGRCIAPLHNMRRSLSMYRQMLQIVKPQNETMPQYPRISALDAWPVPSTAEHGPTIHSLLTDVLKAMKIKPLSPDLVDKLVEHGITTVSMLRELNQQDIDSMVLEPQVSTILLRQIQEYDAKMVKLPTEAFQPHGVAKTGAVRQRKRKISGVNAAPPTSCYLCNETGMYNVLHYKSIA